MKDYNHNGRIDSEDELLYKRWSKIGWMNPLKNGIGSVIFHCKGCNRYIHFDGRRI